ncbi:MAG: hypothetical protein H6623_06155 [Bdellovibrionaceae bacterium]|nr:hypothetical protein [Pseudobdellovibrionaceae bacterium]
MFFNLNPTRIFLLFALVFSSSLIVACSSDTVGSRDVNPNAVHQEYSVEYQETSNSSYISAQFRVGGSTGTTVELEPPSYLKINGTTPHKSSFFGTSYSLDQGGYTSSVTFEYSDDSQHSYVNSVIVKTIQILSAPQNLTIGQSYSVVVSTESLNPGDTVRGYLRQDHFDQGISQSAYVEGVFDVGTQRMIFSSYDTSRLYEGNVELTLVRSHYQALSQSTSRGGGSIGSYYNTRPVILNAYGTHTHSTALTPF